VVVDEVGTVSRDGSGMCVSKLLRTSKRELEKSWKKCIDANDVGLVSDWIKEQIIVYAIRRRCGLASPKSGSAGSAVSPADAEQAAEAIKDVMGSMSIAEATAKARPSNEVPAVKVEPFKPPTKEEIQEKKLTWIEIELLDSHGKTVAGENYLIELTDGKVSRGIFDTDHRMRSDKKQQEYVQVRRPCLKKRINTL